MDTVMFSKICKLVFVAIFMLIQSSYSVQMDRGYYWKDYNGKIPDDAFAGGRDRSGNPLYIGQILHENKLLTTKIYQNDSRGYYGLNGKEYSGVDNHKILCIQHPENFRWVQTLSDKIHLLTDHELVLGGFEPGFTNYIGRVFFQLETLVGKVSTSKTVINYGLFITKNGEEINMYSFEILTYNSSLPSIPIDVRGNCK